MRARFAPVLTLLVLAACVSNAPLSRGQASAQEPAGSLTIAQLDDDAYPDLRAVVTVLGPDGVPAQGLTASEFGAIDSGGGVQVTAVEPVQDSTLSLGVVLVIDVSGSMAGVPLATAKQAATQYVDQLGANDDAALLVFSEQVRTVSGFTADKAALRAGIEGLTAGGATSLYEAVQAAVFAANTSPAPRNAIILLSDGQNDTTTSQVTEAQSLAAANGARVPVFAVGFGDLADTGYLEQLAADTQGAFFRADAGDVSAVYAQIAELLRSQYVLTLRADAPGDGGEASLQVTANVAGGTLTSEPATFTRGAAPVVPATSVPTASSGGTAGGGGGSSTVPVVVALVALAIVGGGGLLMWRRVMASRAQRKREEHAGRVSEEAVPPPLPAARRTNGEPEVRGRIVVMGGGEQGGAFHFGAKPLIIGSDPKADVRLARSPGVAPKHAMVWVRDGKMMLRHTGGTRPTTVNGRAVDWLILDDGDEFVIGPYVYRAELAPSPNGPAPTPGRDAAS